MKINSVKLIEPIRVVSVIFFTQFAVWLLFFDYAIDVESLNKVRFYDFLSIVKYFIFLSVFLFSIYIGKKTLVRININDDFLLNFIVKILFYLFIIFAIAEIIFMYPALAKFNELLLVSEKSSITAFVYEARLHKNPLAALINLFPLIIGISFYIAFFKKMYKKTMYAVLWITFILIMFHGILFSVRILFAYYGLIYIAMYSLYTKKNIAVKKIIISLIIFYIVIFISEYFRYGIYLIVFENYKPLSIELFKEIFLYHMTAYIGSDFNNSLVILSHEPLLSLSKSAAGIIQTIIGLFIDFNSFEHIDIGNHGTVNFLALIWEDWGYGALGILIVIGYFIGFSYTISISSDSLFSKILYPIIFPGVVFIFRINYFFLNIFVIPMIVLFLIITISYGTKKRKKNVNSQL